MLNSCSFDGTYTLSPGGEYKLAVGAHNYEGILGLLMKPVMPHGVRILGEWVRLP